MLRDVDCGIRGRNTINIRNPQLGLCYSVGTGLTVIAK